MSQESSARQALETAPLAQLTALTDGELRELLQGLARLVDKPVVDFGLVRQLLADWALTARLRSHPDFDRNAAVFRKAMEDEVS